MSRETLSHFKSSRHLLCLAEIKNIHLEISQANKEDSEVTKAKFLKSSVRPDSSVGSGSAELLTQQIFAKWTIKLFYCPLFCCKRLKNVSNYSYSSACAHGKDRIEILSKGRNFVKVTLYKGKFQTHSWAGMLRTYFLHEKALGMKHKPSRNVTQIWKRLPRNHPVMDCSHRKSSYTLRISQVSSKRQGCSEWTELWNLKIRMTNMTTFKVKLHKKFPYDCKQGNYLLSF